MTAACALAMLSCLVHLLATSKAFLQVVLLYKHMLGWSGTFSILYGVRRAAKPAPGDPALHR